MMENRGGMNIHHSAMGNAYLVNDDNATQRFSTQEYQNKLDSRRLSNLDEAFHERPVGELDTGPRTYHTGEDGHVNLHEESDKDGSLSTSEDELLSTSPSQSQSQTGTSSISRLPTTPAVTGIKRDRDGNAITPSSRTPAVDLMAFFRSGESHAVGQGLSQLFRQTQAPSSPPQISMLRSDPISERPSPDFRHLRHSSPPLGTSSPAIKRPGTLTRKTSDPRDHYVSMKQSQEMRDSTKKKTLGVEENIDGDELEIDWEVRKMLHKRTVNQIQQEAHRRFANFNTPVSKFRDERRARRASVSDANPTVTQPLRKAVEPIPISDDTPAKVDGSYCSDPESLDEYDELSQAVISSDRRDGLDEDDNALENLESNQVSPRSNVYKLSKSYPSRVLPNSNDNAENSERSGEGRSSSQPLPGVSVSRRLQSVFIADSQQYSMEPFADEMPIYPTIPSSIGLQKLEQTSQQISDAENPKARFDQDLTLDFLQTSSIPPPPVCYGSKSLQTMLIQDPDSDPAVAEASPVILPAATAPVVSGISNHVAPLEARRDKHGSDDRALNVTEIQTYRIPKVCEIVPETSPATAAKLQGDQGSLAKPEAVTVGVAGIFDATSKGHMASNKTVTSGLRTDDLYHSARSERSSSPKPVTTKSQSEVMAPVAGFKKLTDISASAEPSDQSEVLDYSGINIMTEEDHQYAKAISGTSPTFRSPKRRRFKRHNSAIFGSPINSKLAHSPLQEEGKPTTERDRSRSIPKPSKNFSKRGTSRPRTSQSERCDAPLGDATSTSLTVEPNNEENPELSLVNKELPDERESNIINMGSDSPVSTLSKQRTPTPPSQLQVLEPTPGTNSDIAEKYRTALSRRVFAKFRGSNNAYYTATVLAPSGTVQAPAMRVRFDDGSEDDVSSFRISRLELREGDEVKVDLPGLRNNVYIIKEFTDRVKPDPQDPPWHLETDVYGFKKVRLHLKSRSHINTGEEGSGRVTAFETAISNLYIPSSRWSNYADRVFDASALLVPDEARPITPVLVPSPPTTPSSRTRGQRATEPVPRMSDILPGPSSKEGIFANMMFAVTFMDSKDPSKARVIHCIEKNGGQVLANGFHELFDLPSYRDEETSAASSSSSWEDSALDEQTLSQSIKPSAARLGFTALIADVHSRKAKHMQALALNLPCLSYLWVMDSVSRERIIPWQRYLLSAGESTYLKATKSQTIGLKNVCDASLPSLQDLLSARPKLLDGLSIIAVTGRGKAKVTRQAYIFLILALGAQRIHQVPDLAAAKKFLTKENAYKWNWVYVDDGSRTAAKKYLSMLHIQHRPRVVRDEYVIQSLIVGMLLDANAFSVDP